jgi:hypothetical protein
MKIEAAPQITAIHVPPALSQSLGIVSGLGTPEGHSASLPDVAA